ncbi:prostaglandin F2 receptor negative regulator isoform X2 [Antennarius striatus]|uniref:prostaglandin F2 receptor negative regulator isoform X2 n=1 Tax=Antennarius striatus TaxID=241820 RepID=UPI0035B26B36
MLCGLAVVWGAFLLGGVSSRVVTVSPGPLIRVEGQPVSIRCDVSEYGGPREQDFEWMMSREAGGQRMKIISTFDAGYSHPSLSKRVASGDISVQRLRDNEVELKVAEATAQDAGFYWCQTPSTDSVISGNYEAQVQLTVIPNSLQVAPQAPPPVVPEGSDLTLTCSVTRELVHPTYLSVTWSLKRGATSEEVLTFGPQGDVTVGPKFARRYADGSIRLVPGRNGVFDLVIYRVTSSDEGVYECNGTEWTHERGGRWVRIVQSTKEMGTVSVTPTGRSLSVKASSSSSSSSALLVAPGNTLTLLCSVAADNLPVLALEVTWLADGRDIITMERSGVVAPNASWSGGPGGRGQASLERTGAGEYRLGVRGVAGEDGGAYACRVRAFIEKGGRSAGGGGRWHMAAEKTSSPVTVKVAQIQPNFTLTLEPITTPQATAEPTELACHVTNITRLPPGGHLGVSWGYSPLPAAGTGDDRHTSHTVASLDGRGNLLAGAEYADRLGSGVLSLTRVPPDTFKLRFLHTQEVDMGRYVCVVSAWTPSSGGDLVKTTELQSPPQTVQWQVKRPSLNVLATPLRDTPVGGATFEMSCSVDTENLEEAGYSVLVQSQDGVEGSVRTIMTLSPDGVLQPGGATDPSRRDNLVLTKSGPAEFRFRLGGVQLGDRGFYWCDITAWTRPTGGHTWTRAAGAESNKLRLHFQENGPAFSIAIQSDTSSVYPHETAKMECSLSASGSPPKTDSRSGFITFTRSRGFC